MGVDLRHQRLHFRFLFTPLLGLDLFDQFADLGAHPVKAVNQRIAFILGTGRSVNGCEDALFHPLHSVHRTINAAHQPAYKIMVEQKGGDKRNRTQYKRNIADRHRL
ncbi:hypothetical protein D3C74_434140 [compost metagenome]